VTSDQSHLGKPAGHDLLEGSVTLPVIHALSAASPADRTRMLHLLDAACVPQGAENGNSPNGAATNGGAHEAATEVFALVQRYDGVTYAHDRARAYAARARAALTAILQNPASEILDAVCDFVIARKA
jgi:geranylgeranyl pyrophosphate synthase